jgi:hypothetical protein
MPDNKYQRLTYSRGRGVFAVAVQSRVSLWLGEDHLLCADSNGYSETYKRFYFRDIQAITIRQSTRRNVWNAILVLPVATCLLGLIVSLLPGHDTAAIVVWSIFGTLFVAPFVINNVRGPTCTCQLRTAVQIEELPSLCRVRKARRVIEQIRPLVAAAQGGELPAEAVSALMRERVASSAATEPAKAVPDESNVPPRLSA